MLLPNFLFFLLFIGFVECQDVKIEATATDAISDPPLTGSSITTHQTTEWENTEVHDNVSVTVQETTIISETLPPAYNWSACIPNPCKNGGTCEEDTRDSESFSCTCRPGYTGPLCRTLDSCETHEDGDLCRGGRCVYAEDSLSRKCKCYAGQYWDEGKRECRDPKLPCFPNPCKNGGTCVDTGDSFGEFQCTCPPRFEGLNCRIENKCGSGNNCGRGACVIDEQLSLKYCKCDKGLFWNDKAMSCEAIVAPCVPNPCRNSGECQVLSSGEFNCSCSTGYSGPTCGITDHCTSDEDCGNGTCVVNGRVRRCQCDYGYYLDERTQSCLEVRRPCYPNPCSNDGLCSPSSDGFNCTCSDGYMGTRCRERDYCVLHGGNTYCGEAECSNDEQHGIFHCMCDPGQYFDYSSRVCKHLDMCPLMKCKRNEVCSMSECSCMKKYEWRNETQKCEPNACASNPCPIDEMVCEEGEDASKYRCSCPEGYAFNGIACKRAACTFPSLNQCDQICKETSENDYECSCYDEFEIKEDNMTCLYVGNNTCENETCENRYCVKKNDLEICICPPGYSDEYGKCVDHCSTGQLMTGYCPNDKCKPSPSSGFQCECEGKFVLSKDKVTCEVRKVCDRSEVGFLSCASLNARCVEDWSTDKGFRCECGFGQVQTTPTDACQDVCSIESNQQTCASKGGLCDVGNNGGAKCKCPPFFEVDETGATCSKPAKFSILATLPLDFETYRVGNDRERTFDKDSEADYKKVTKDVTETMGQMFAEFLQANILICKKMKDYFVCKMELQFLEMAEMNRLKIEDDCIVSENKKSGSCLLPPKLVLKKDKLKSDINIGVTDPCDEDLKQDLCGSETTCVSSDSKKSFNCSCKAGFAVRNKVYPFNDTESVIELCKDIDECAESSPCPENTKCVNTIGGYLCKCLPGYRAGSSVDPKQDGCVEQCNPNPCTHGTCLKRGDHHFDCRCDAGYSGALCNLEDKNFKGARVNTIIVGVVLGGILLLTIILSIAFISRLRRKKSMDDPGNILYNATEMTERRPLESGAINNAYQRD